MYYKQKIGNLGENIAKNFLVRKGYQIITTNFKVRGGEIDIVCKKGDFMVFVEVKTRTNQSFGYPEESFNFSKKKRFRRAALRYLMEIDYDGPWRPDFISIEIDKMSKKAKVRHYEGVELE